LFYELIVEMILPDFWLISIGFVYRDDPKKYVGWVREFGLATSILVSTEETSRRAIVARVSVRNANESGE